MEVNVSTTIKRHKIFLHVIALSIPSFQLQHSETRGKSHVNECRRALVNNPIKESFYRKRKKTINILTTFFISHKSNIKTFLKWIVNYYPKG